MPAAERRSVVPPSLAAYVECLDRHDLDGVAALMLASAEKLARAGADFLICPDNTIHAPFSCVVTHSPLPWLHIADGVAAEAERRGFQRVGITGTRWRPFHASATVTGLNTHPADTAQAR